MKALLITAAAAAGKLGLLAFSLFFTGVFLCLGFSFGNLLIQKARTA